MIQKAWAIFIGWQEQDPPHKPFPLFNIGPGHDYSGDTVSLETLKVFGIAVPEYPSFDEWKSK